MLPLPAKRILKVNSLGRSTFGAAYFAFEYRKYETLWADVGIGPYEKSGTAYRLTGGRTPPRVIANQSAFLALQSSSGQVSQL